MKTPTAVLPQLVAESDTLYALERFTPAQAAGYLGIAIDSVYSHAAGGRIGYRRAGRRILFSQADLDLWRAAHRVPARDAATTKVRRARQSASSSLPSIGRRVFDPNSQKERSAS
jgi:excisionase family DNA binding protein